MFALLCILILLNLAVKGGTLCVSSTSSEVVNYRKSSPRGSLSLSCSGEEFIITYDTRVETFYNQLEMFAECSKSCNSTHTLYYFDTSNIPPHQYPEIIRGSSALGMPLTEESGNCTVMGCYRTLFPSKKYRFTTAFCAPETRNSRQSSTTSRTTTSQRTFGTSISQHHFGTTSTNFQSNLISPFISENASNYSEDTSDDNLYSEEQVQFVAVGIALSVVVTVVLVLLSFVALLKFLLSKFYHKKRPPVIVLHFNEMFDSIPPSDEAKINLDFKKNSLLTTPAVSQISIFNKFQRLPSTLQQESNREKIPQV